MNKVYKVYIMTLLFVSLFSGAHAQFLGGIFSQKKTQTEYLQKQVAALQVYIGYLEKGYNIAKKGLGTIGDIKSGHFTLDQLFLDGLKQVHPAVKNYPRVPETMALATEIKQLSDKTLQDAKNSEHLSGWQREYARKVLQEITRYAAGYASELADLLSSGKLQMNDQERLDRIDALYREMSGLYRFVCQFSGDLKLLSAGQQQDAGSGKVVKQLYGL